MDLDMLYILTKHKDKPQLCKRSFRAIEFYLQITLYLLHFAYI